MNLLLFVWQRQFHDDVIVVANNHKDLEDYLNTLGLYNVEIASEYVRITACAGYERDYIELKWVRKV